jgi:hypothetical protein
MEPSSRTLAPDAVNTPSPRPVALGIAGAAAIAIAGCQSPPREVAQVLGTDILAGRKNVRIHIQRLTTDYRYGWGYIRFDATAGDVADVCERVRAAGGDALPIDIMRPSWQEEHELELSWWTPTKALMSPACAYRLASGGLVYAKLEAESAFVKVNIP